MYSDYCIWDLNCGPYNGNNVQICWCKVRYYPMRRYQLVKLEIHKCNIFHAGESSHWMPLRSGLQLQTCCKSADRWVSLPSSTLFISSHLTIKFNLSDIHEIMSKIHALPTLVFFGCDLEKSFQLYHQWKSSKLWLVVNIISKKLDLWFAISLAAEC